LHFSLYKLKTRTLLDTLKLIVVVGQRFVSLVGWEKKIKRVRSVSMKEKIDGQM
jgi:hypothetical protein